MSPRARLRLPRSAEALASAEGIGRFTLYPQSLRFIGGY